MADGRTVWWAKDSAWWRREAIVELGEEFGAGGPAVLDWLACEAKAQNDGGVVRAGYRAIARGCFVELVTVRHVVSRAVELGALEDLEGDDRRFDCRLSGWHVDQERGRGAIRQAGRRDAATHGTEPTVAAAAAAACHGLSRAVTPRHAESLTGQDRRREPPPPPAGGGSTDLGDQETGDTAPAPPSSSRVRDRDAYARQLATFTERHFPGLPPGYVELAAGQLRLRGKPPTAELLRPRVERYRVAS